MNLFMISCAFCAGIIGALVGAFEECMLAGFLAIVVCMFPDNEVLSNCLTYGFIPFVAFTGAVAGTAYASKIRKHNLNGSDILKSLNVYNDITVLIVSGIFAVAGVSLTYAIGLFHQPIDAGAINVIIISIIVRIIFGDGHFWNKKIREIPRYSTQKSEWAYLIFLGVVIGFAAAWLGIVTGNIWLPFYLSLASLLFYFIEPNFPPTHHITCVAAYAFMATKSLFASAVWGAIAIVTMTFIGDAINTDASTHIDPPATAIGVLSIIIWLIYDVIL
jgi:hypothetical protein